MNRHRQLIAKILPALIVLGIALMFGGCTVIYLELTVEVDEDLFKLSSNHINDLDFPYNMPFLDTKKDVELISSYYDAHEGQIPRGGEAIIGYGESPLKMRLVFVDYIESLGGNWRGESVQASIECPYSTTMQAKAGNTERKWGDRVSSDIHDASPFVDVEIPITELSFNAPLEERYILLDISMEVAYPVESGYLAPGAGTFVNQHSTLEHSSRIYLLSPDETEEYFEIKERIKAKSDVELYYMSAAWILAGAAILVAVYLFSKKSKIKPNWDWGK